jgi:hypothetical protein
MPAASPIAVPEHHFLQIVHAASWLSDRADRERFFAAVYAELCAVAARADGPVGDGAVGRAIAKVFLTLFEPPLELEDGRGARPGRRFQKHGNPWTKQRSETA